MESKIVFNKDESAATLYVMKVFSAEVKTVWDHFTQAELLDLWWAPKPWKCETMELDFNPNGKWRYAMTSPEGEKHFSAAQFNEINEERSFDRSDYFSDEDGNQLPTSAASNWLIGFTGVEEGTKLTVNIHFQSSEDLNKLLEMGFEGGFKMGLNQLEQLIEKK